MTSIYGCGKSSLMLSIIDEILDNGVDKENIIYIDLDKRKYKRIKEAVQLEKS